MVITMIESPRTKFTLGRRLWGMIFREPLVLVEKLLTQLWLKFLAQTYSGLSPPKYPPTPEALHLDSNKKEPPRWYHVRQYAFCPYTQLFLSSVAMLQEAQLNFLHSLASGLANVRWREALLLDQFTQDPGRRRPITCKGFCIQKVECKIPWTKCKRFTSCDARMQKAWDRRLANAKYFGCVTLKCKRFDRRR